VGISTGRNLVGRNINYALDFLAGKWSSNPIGILKMSANNGGDFLNGTFLIDFCALGNNIYAWYATGQNDYVISVLSGNEL
jgi:hypothetical protein